MGAASPQAVVLFLKAAGLEPQWTTDYAAKAPGIDRATAKEMTAELALMGLRRAGPARCMAEHLNR